MNNAISNFVKRVKEIKNIKIIVLVFIIAVALIIYSSVATSSESVSYMSDEEMRLASILSSVNGAGDVEVMISQSGNQISGVLVLADGANNPLVRIRLVEATSSALGIDYTLVSVMTRNKN